MSQQQCQTAQLCGSGRRSMSRVLILALTVLLFLAVTTVGVSAIDADDAPLPATGRPLSDDASGEGHPVIYALGELTDNPFKMVANGEKNDVTIQVLNTHDRPVRVATARGLVMSKSSIENPTEDLTAVDDFKSRKVLRNMTAYVINRVIEPQQNETVHYKFLLDVEPEQYGLAVILGVEYEILKEDEDGEEVLTTANQALLSLMTTITVVDNSSFLDLQSLGIYCIFIFVAGGFIYINFYAPGSSKKRGKKSSVAKAAPEAPLKNANMDWIPEHVTKIEKSRNRGRK